MSATLHLYDLAQAREILDDWLLESEGELTPAIEQLLNELEERVETKIHNVALYIRELRRASSAIGEEAKALAARAKRSERAADSLTEYLQRQMERLGTTKVEGPLVTVALQDNPPKVVGEVDEETLFEWTGDVHLEDYVRTIPARHELNRKAVLDAYKAGALLPEPLGIERTRSVRIRQ